MTPYPHDYTPTQTLTRSPQPTQLHRQSTLRTHKVKLIYLIIDYNHNKQESEV